MDIVYNDLTINNGLPPNVTAERLLPLSLVQVQTDFAPAPLWCLIIECNKPSHHRINISDATELVVDVCCIEDDYRGFKFSVLHNQIVDFFSNWAICGTLLDSIEYALKAAETLDK